MHARTNFESLLAQVKDNYLVLNELQPTLTLLNLSEAQLQEIYLTAVKADGRAITFVPESQHNEEILIALIMHAQNKNEIEEILRAYIHPINSTYNILVAIAKKEITLLIEIKNNWDHIAKQFNLTDQQTYATLCLDVLQDNWRAMRFYPGALIEDNTVLNAIEKCKLDISQNWQDIVYIPDYLLEDAFFQPSLLKARQAILSGELEPTLFTSARILTEECCLAAVARNSYNFNHIPSILRTKQVCLEAIKEDAYQLTNIEKPEDRLGLTPNQYENLCLEAIEMHGAKALAHIPEQMRTYNLYLQTLNKDQEVLQFLKENHGQSGLTAIEYDNILQIASEKYGKEAVVRFTPPEIRTKSLWITAVLTHVSELYNLTESITKTKLSPDDYQEIYLAAIAKHGVQVLPHIAPKRWTYTVCVAAVNNNVDALHFITKGQIKTLLKTDEYMAIFAIAKDKYGIKATFSFFPPEMKTYEVCLTAVNEGVEILTYLKKEDDRKTLTSEQYHQLCLSVIKMNYIRNIAPDFKDAILINFIDHYDSTNNFTNYNMDDIGTFFSKNKNAISNIYTLLGQQIFVLMEKMLVTSADNLNRFLSFSIFNKINAEIIASCSKNLSRLFDNIDYKNVNNKASNLKQYISLSNEERKEINILLDDSKTNIETIPTIIMRELVIKRFYVYLKLPYNKENKIADTLNNEQLADLNNLLEELKQKPNQDMSRIFFSMLKMYFGNIPFPALHKPDEMSKYGDEYMVNMAIHNKNLRTELAKGGINVDKAFSYKEQLPLTFDEYNKQKILKILAVIYKRIKKFNSDKKSDAIDKNIKNLLTQLEKGQKKSSEESKLLRMLSNTNLNLLSKIVNNVKLAIKPDIETEYLELTKLLQPPLET